MVGHAYFTDNCSDENCSHRNEKYKHFHCTLCKTWGCNGKKVSNAVMFCFTSNDRDTGSPRGPWPPQMFSVVASVSLYSFLILVFQNIR